MYVIIYNTIIHIILFSFFRALVCNVYYTYIYYIELSFVCQTRNMDLHVKFWCMYILYVCIINYTQCTRYTTAKYYCINIYINNGLLYKLHFSIRLQYIILL